MRLALIPIAAALLFAACTDHASVIEFSNDAAQIAALLPEVAAVPYTACVDQHLMQQIDNAIDLPNRITAANECQAQAQVRDRVTKTYGVLTRYLEVLGKVASGHGGTSDAGTDTSGLAGALAAAYSHAGGSVALRRAITKADPELQSLCSAFSSEVKPAMLGSLQGEEQQLKALYGDNKSTGALRLLLMRQLDSDQLRIERSRDLVAKYSSILTKIAAAHAKLYANRDRLNTREALDTLIAVSDALALDLKAIGK